uniref:Uncharacterized protein n=1 Tax=Romanomermis culicivorax TaxID=13658 RepID=A0A915HXC9_ROMCU
MKEIHVKKTTAALIPITSKLSKKRLFLLKVRSFSDQGRRLRNSHDSTPQIAGLQIPARIQSEHYMANVSVKNRADNSKTSKATKNFDSSTSKNFH